MRMLSIYLPPGGEGFGPDHRVWYAAMDEAQMEVAAGNGMTGWENITSLSARMSEATIPHSMVWENQHDRGWGCWRCEKFCYLASARLARHEGRMETYLRLMARLSA